MHSIVVHSVPVYYLLQGRILLSIEFRACIVPESIWQEEPLQMNYNFYTESPSLISLLPSSLILRPHPKQSMNKITKQNHEILQRIIRARPTFDRTRWINAERERKLLVNRIAVRPRGTSLSLFPSLCFSHTVFCTVFRYSSTSQLFKPQSTGCVCVSTRGSFSP